MEKEIATEQNVNILWNDFTNETFRAIIGGIKNYIV